MQFPQDLIGFLAGTLTTLAFLPQALLTWRSKCAKGVSLGMYCVFISGVVLWLVYGLILMSWPMIVSNCVTLAIAVSILLMKLRYR